MTNTPNPGDQAVEAVAVTQADRDWLCRELEAWRPDVCTMTGLPRGADVENLADKLLHRLSAIPTPPADTDLKNLTENLTEMLAAPGMEEGCVIFDHTPEEIGLEVMENHVAVLALLQAHASPRELQITAKLLGEVMQDAWGEICADTGCHPDDIRREGRRLFYVERHWTDLIAMKLNAHFARTALELG